MNVKTTVVGADQAGHGDEKLATDRWRRWLLVPMVVVPGLLILPASYAAFIGVVLVWPLFLWAAGVALWAGYIRAWRGATLVVGLWIASAIYNAGGAVASGYLLVESSEPHRSGYTLLVMVGMFLWCLLATVISVLLVGSKRGTRKK